PSGRRRCCACDRATVSVNNPNVSELHRLCVNALHGYISETNKTCRLLEQITAFPPPIEQRMAMLDQRGLKVTPTSATRPPDRTSSMPPSGNKAPADLKMWRPLKLSGVSPPTK